MSSFNSNLRLFRYPFIPHGELCETGEELEELEHVLGDVVLHVHDHDGGEERTQREDDGVLLERRLVVETPLRVQQENADFPSSGQFHHKRLRPDVHPVRDRSPSATPVERVPNPLRLEPRRSHRSSSIASSIRPTDRFQVLEEEVEREGLSLTEFTVDGDGDEWPGSNLVQEIVQGTGIESDSISSGTDYRHTSSWGHCETVNGIGSYTELVGLFCLS
jgi:hypothetical protein